MDTPSAPRFNPHNAPKELKRKGDPLMKHPPSKKTCSDETVSLRLDFLCQGQKNLQPLPVDQLVALIDLLRGHRNTFRRDRSFARRLGKPTTTSAHLEHCSRSFKGRALVLGRENKTSLDWVTVMTIAASHPEQFKCELSEDGSRILRINEHFLKLENDDYLAIQSKRLFPDPYAHEVEDLELEAKEVDIEKANCYSLRQEFERGIRYIDEVLPKVREREFQIKRQLQDKLEEEVPTIADDEEGRSSRTLEASH